MFTTGPMADEHEQPEREWDEYEWERFLQNQDLRTERYLELLERYVDHPERDVIIAREMGWFDSSAWDGDGEEDCADCQDTAGSEGSAGAAGSHGEGGGAGDEDEEEHPLYRIAFELTVWLDGVLEARGTRATEHPAAMELAKQACILGGKVAAALSGPEESEIGMTIAYLKRALRAANLALNAYAEVHRERLLGRVRDKQLREKLFEVRDAIVLLMGGLRAERRRRPEP
jgi:hypothetical protein